MTINSAYASGDLLKSTQGDLLKSTNVAQKSGFELTTKAQNSETLSESQSFSYANFSEPASYKTPYNYRIDGSGTFEKALNRAANIPQSYDINIKSVQSIAKSVMMGSGTEIDLPSLLNEHYSVLSAVEREFSLDDNAILSREEIRSLNQGFSTQSGEFDGEIMRIYGSFGELKSAKSLNNELQGLFLNNQIIDFGFTDATQNTANNDAIKPYLTSDGKVSKSGLLMNFISQNTNKNSPLLFVDALGLSRSTMHERFYELMSDESTPQSLLGEQKHMTFDFYLYLHGISKHSTAPERLVSVYQQYLAREKNANIQDFADSSAAYAAYSQALVAKLRAAKAEFSAQSEPELILTANTARLTSLNAFKTQQKTSFDRNSILRAYLSVME